MSEKPTGYPGQQPYPQQAYPPQQPGNVAPPPAYSQQPGYAAPPAYPQQPGYPVAQPGHLQTTTTIIQQPTVIATVPMYMETPVQMTCPYCSATIVTSTSYDPGTLAWLACLGLAFVGCWLGCCLIPFCVDGCKDCVHQCPNCQRQLGVYRRM